MLGRKTEAGLVLAAMTATGVGAVPADAGATAPREHETAAHVAAAEVDATAEGVRVTELPASLQLDTLLPADILNDRGQVGGIVEQPDGTLRAHVWHRGRLTEVPVPPTDERRFTSVLGLNGRGDVVGLYQPGPDSQRHFFATIRGRPYDLGPARYLFTAATINDRGQVLLEGDRVWQGGETIPAPTVDGETPLFTQINDRGWAVGRLPGPVPVLWRVGGQARQLPTPEDGTPYAEPLAINDAGLVLGAAPTGGLLWHHGWPVPLEPPVAPGDMNGRGEVAGLVASADPDEVRLVLWRRGDLVDLAPPDDLMDLDRLRMNDRGQVVFWGDHRHPYVYQDGEVFDLAEAAGVPEAFVLDINNRGQVVGYVDGPSGRRPVMWTVPPPGGRPRS